MTKRSQGRVLLGVTAALVTLAVMLVWFASPARAQRSVTVQNCGTFTGLAPVVGSAGVIAYDTAGNACVAAPSGVVTQPDAGNATAGTGTGTCAATCNGTALFSIDTTNYNAVAFQLTAAGTGTITFQASNDNATWLTVTCQSPLLVGTGAAFVNTVTVVGAYYCPAQLRYFRAQFTAYTSGTFTANFAARATYNPQYVNMAANGNAASITIGTLADASANANTLPLNVLDRPYLFNGTTWDRYRTIGGAVAAGTGTAAVALAPNNVATGGVPILTSAALATSQVVCSAACNLYGFEVSADATLSAAAWWIMIFNATSNPADGAVAPAKCYAVPLGTPSYASSFPTPVRFSTGAVLAVSTTGCFAKTDSIHAFLSGDAQQ